MNFKYILLIIWIVDFSYIYIKLIQEKELEKNYNQINDKLPSYCKNSSKWNIFRKTLQFIHKQFRFSSYYNECQKYYVDDKLETIWKVNPFLVLAHQFEDLVCKPLIGLGKAVGFFVYHLTNLSSWGNFIPMLILLPFVFTLIYFVLCVILSFCFKRTFNIQLLKHFIFTSFYVQKQHNSNDNFILKQEQNLIEL